MIKKPIIKQFFDDYSEYVANSNEKWMRNFNNLKKYMDEFDKMPTGSDKNDDIRYLGKWLGTQKRTFEKKQQIMKDPTIYNIWKKFVEQHGKFFD